VQLRAPLDEDGSAGGRSHQAKAALGGAEYAWRVYAVDDRDVVVVLTNVPASCAGAPEPVVLADEGRVTVAYYAPDNIDWNTAKPEDLGDEEVVVLRFDHVRSFMFGAPNNEALHGHPLAERGLEHYAAHTVEQSSWVRQLELTRSRCRGGRRPWCVGR
jgi:hypothetical protein